MKKRQISQKPEKREKKNFQQQSGLEDLATYEEDQINSMFQSQQFEMPKRKLPQQNFNVDDDEEEEYNIDDIKKSAEKKQNQDKLSEQVLIWFHKNKINDKNAFDIPIIDIKDLKTEGDNAWKLISANLDAGSKIYGYRVDMVHQSTYKVLGGIHRTSTNFDENQEQAQGLEQEQEQLKKRKIVNTGGDSTLEKNIANLDTNKYDLEFEIDPLFQQTSAKFDEAGAKGLLLNNLSISENLVLALDSELLRETSKEKQILANKNFNADVLDSLRQNLRRILTSDLCPELAQFRQEILQRGQELFDLKNLGTHFNDVMRNNPKFEIKENEEYIMDDQQDEEQFMQEVDQIAGEQMLHTNYDKIRMSEAQNYKNEPQEDDYDYHPDYYEPKDEKKNFNLKQFEGAVKQIGTGKIFITDNEKHDWMNFEVGGKLMKKKPSNGDKAQKNQKTRAKGELPFSFSDKDTEERNIVFQKRPKEIYLPYLDHKQLYLLPRPHHIDRLNFMEFYQRRWEKDLPTVHEVMDYDEPEEQQIPNEEFMPETFQGFGVSLQNAKESYVQGITIPIKELKVKMWKALESKIPSSNQKTGLAFSTVTADLPKILQIPESKMKVSIQTCFVTLLHLANEENLKFLGFRDEQDFEIQKEQ